MSAAINTGGPAFPIADPFAVHQPGHVDVAKRLMEGMSLRDYFAAHEPIDPMESIGLQLAERLAGRVFPKGTEGKAADPVEVALFYADAEAAYRYLRADAMLRAREGDAS